MFAWIRDEPEALVVWVESLEDKEALVASEPQKFFTTSHYDGQPIVLIRLEAVDGNEIAEFVLDSWRLPRESSRCPTSRVSGPTSNRARRRSAGATCPPPSSRPAT
jgi:hypothetical protein